VQLSVGVMPLGEPALPGEFEALRLGGPLRALRDNQYLNGARHTFNATLAKDREERKQ
jgi:hypothetical protein